jgi:hypothetical protein
MSKTYEATIGTKAGSQPIKIQVEANDQFQARKLIEMRPEFKRFLVGPSAKR